MFLVYLKLCDDDELEYDDYQKETDRCRKRIPISSVKYKHVIPEIERLKWKEVLPVNDDAEKSDNNIKYGL